MTADPDIVINWQAEPADRYSSDSDQQIENSS